MVACCSFCQCVVQANRQGQVKEERFCLRVAIFDLVLLSLIPIPKLKVEKELSQLLLQISTPQQHDEDRILFTAATTLFATASSPCNHSSNFPHAQTYQCRTLQKFWNTEKRCVFLRGEGLVQTSMKKYPPARVSSRLQCYIQQNKY